MNIDSLKELLADFKSGRISEKEILDALRTLPFEDLGFAKVDHHRSLRTGFPEVVFGEGKTEEQILAIAHSMVKKKTNFLVTRCAATTAHALGDAFPDGVWNESGSVFYLETSQRARHGYVLVITAGTTDIPVAEEAAVTATLFGCNVERIYDVGVAGVQRLMAYQSKIEVADVIVVAAGMEGALASVVAGMVRVPVVALPTSVGYGANFGGLAALLSMMTSCSAGVTVVNIDNGFGAGSAAALIVQRAHELARNIERELNE
ncbi:MAG: nickel pincer cofactor biosynthesis protein LarB [Candidatus Krumholzibacteriota bacterium]|nr:nickel pincer cofactor biosynthesis protein LarB [Candidatus Krumholzibacteriota bacterium]